MNKRDLSIPMHEAATKSLWIMLPLMAIQAAMFILMHGFPIPQSSNLPLYGFLLLVGIFIHEAIHVLAWMLFGKKSLKVFHIGFQWKSLAPYAHCKEPMDILPYRIGSFAPGLLLGFLPWAVSLFTGDILLFIYGWLYTTAAGGDFLILWILRDMKPNTLVEDHPTRAGCYVIDSPVPDSH
jgi:hypothetical protein